jgi:hypothetical protein
MEAAIIGREDEFRAVRSFLGDVPNSFAVKAIRKRGRR